MTREKKELLKKIEEINIHIQVDMELGCGFAPAGFYDSAYEEIYKLEEKLAKLRNFSSVEEMRYDYSSRWIDREVLPFM